MLMRTIVRSGHPSIVKVLSQLEDSQARYETLLRAVDKVDGQPYSEDRMDMLSAALNRVAAWRSIYTKVLNS